jgi:hypothetical protein
MSSAAGRMFGLVVVTVAFCVLLGLYIGDYLTAAPGAAAAIQTAQGTSLYLATVPAAEPNDPHPDWVSYYVVKPDLSDWQHDTTFVLPANTVVHVTIYQFDGDSGLRNPFLAQAEGTIGDSFLLNGKPTKAINNNNASHIFSIPNIGLSVPLEGVPGTAKNPCANAPCSSSFDHETITFSFKTPAKGLYRWQCFVPCAAGYIQGWGGPMQTVGYMDGFIKVV